MRTITAKELKPILEEQSADTAFVDVRLPWEFARMHIPGFVNIPYDDIEKRSDEFKDKKAVYLLCQIGDNSGNMGRMLEAAGYHNEFFNIRGGLIAWADQGYLIDANDEEGNPTLSKMRDSINLILRKMK